jgi:glycine oxidase
VSGPRVTVLGAGVVGAACARSLADGGACVRVIDPGAGRSAGSWAAAGILSPSHPEDLPGPVHALAARSLELWEGIARRHPRIELRRTGLLLVGDDPAWLAWRTARGMAAEPATWTLPGGREAAGHRFPEVRVVRTPRVVPALLGDITVETATAPLARLRSESDVVVIATGAWAAPLLGEAVAGATVAPRRGQMLLFARGRIDTVLMQAGPAGVHLALPRADGRVVVGTTLEDVGFDAGTVPADLDRLEAWAREWVPGLGPREDAWSGFRPWSDRPVPLIGPLAPGLVAAVGHFRNGILLAPATGELVADLILGRAPRVTPGDFSARPL